MTRLEFFRKNWVMSLIGLVVFLVAIASVIYAVLTGEGDEGFMKDRNGNPLVWARSDLPLTCFYDESVDDQQYEMDQARDQIKNRVGNVISICDPWQIAKPFPVKPVRGAILLRVARPDEMEGDGVYVSSPWEPQHGGTTQIYMNKDTEKIYGVTIYVNPDVPKELRVQVWLHEFLHAFGMEHDRMKGSVMYPSASSRTKTLSDRDVARLKKEYVQ